MLEPADHGRHRLFAEARPARELPHAQAVLLIQRQQHRPGGGTNVGVAGGGEALGQQLVPALSRLREEKPEIVAAEGRCQGLRRLHAPS